MTRVDMSLKLQLCFLVLFANGIAEPMEVWQHKTVMEGDTLTLRCPIKNGHKSNVEWKNPREYLMFFNHNKVALRERRYSIVKLSKREFTVQVSDVNFKDGGIYTCLHYHHRHSNVTTKRVQVTVLGTPKLEITKRNGGAAIKCSAEGNSHAPKISWQLGNGLEITAPSTSAFDKETDKYSSQSTLHFLPWKERVTVKCIVHHPALISPNQIDTGVQIRLDPVGVPPAEISTEIPRPITERSTEIQTERYSNSPSTQRSTEETLVTAWPRTEGSPTTTTGSYLATISHPDTTVSESKKNISQNDTISNSTTTTTDLLPATETTKDTSHNGTGGNSTNVGGESDRQAEERNAPLLVFLVTCLIFALLVVVMFFAIKLRRAHMIWKKENEESDQSVESSKSKSNHEDTISQERRRRGLFNIGFTKYVVEEPTEVATESTTTTTTTTRDTKTEEIPESQTIPETHETTKDFQTRETEL